MLQEKNKLIKNQKKYQSKVSILGHAKSFTFKPHSGFFQQKRSVSAWGLQGIQQECIMHSNKN
jgi:hypothetical protein